MNNSSINVDGALLGYYRALERHVLGREDHATMFAIKALSWERTDPTAAAYVPTNRTICRILKKDPKGYEAAVTRALQRLKKWDMLLEYPDAPGFLWINVQFANWHGTKREEIAGWDEQHRPMDLPIMNTELRYLVRDCFLAKVNGEIIRRIFPTLDPAAVRTSIPGQAVDGQELGRNTAGGKHGTTMRPEAGMPAPDGNHPGFSFTPQGISGPAAAGVLEEKSRPLGAAVAKMLEEKSSTTIPANENAGFGVLEEKSSTPPFAAKAVSPPHTPPLKTISIDSMLIGRAQAYGGKEQKPLPWWHRTKRITRQEDRYLMERFTEAVGAQAMEHSGGFWRARVAWTVRSEIIEEWVGDCISKIRTGFVFRNSPGAWLNNMLARHLGLKNLGELPRGEPPVE